MNNAGKPTMNVIVTVAQLVELAQCSRRMTDYADVNGSLLITILSTQSGVPIRLVLDRSCIHPMKPKATNFDSS
jgi:hypothetical protein